jgi:hypothetical protein
VLTASCPSYVIIRGKMNGNARGCRGRIGGGREERQSRQEKFSCQMMETYQMGAFCGARLVESAFRFEIC